MPWWLIAVGCFLGGWILGWVMGISRTTTIYRAMLREGADARMWMLLLATLLLGSAGEAWSQVPCTHWASPNGSGGSCTQSQPCKVSGFWQHAQPGRTLCLKPGTYTGGDNMVVPPQTLKGAEGNPITIRADQDGTVLIDAQNGGFAVWLSGTSGGANHWFVVEGINATNGDEAVYRVSGNHNTLRRVVGWNGKQGANDSNIFRITGQGNWCEDCAGWGWNSRKIMDMAQGNNVGGGGFLRGWAEWNDHPGGQSKPDNTWLISYNTANARFYNVLGTWDLKGEVANAEGIMEVARQCDGNTEAEGTKVKGAVMYVRPGASYQPSMVVSGFCASNFYLEDVAALVPPGYGARPFQFFKGSGSAVAGSVCQNCLGVHGGNPSSNDSNSGWSMPGFREGNSLQAATGGTSAFTLQPGNCKRYDRSGNLTNEPLWPWPMAQRIKEARQASGYSPIDVTQEVEAIMGPIPASCKSGDVPPPSGDTTPPTVVITAPSPNALVSGTIAVTVAASDNTAVTGVQFYLDDEEVHRPFCCEQVHTTADTTNVTNGLHTLTAKAFDAAGNSTMSAPVSVQVFNGSQPPQPPTGAHPAMTCTGALKDAGVIDLRCTPEVTQRWER